MHHLAIFFALASAEALHATQGTRAMRSFDHDAAIASALLTIGASPAQVARYLIPAHRVAWRGWVDGKPRTAGLVGKARRYAGRYSKSFDHLAAWLDSRGLETEIVPGPRGGAHSATIRFVS